MAIEENMNGRGFNEVEKARAVYYILKVLEEPEDRIETLLSQLSIPVNPRTLSRYLQLHAAPATMKLSIANGEISFHTFAMMSRLDTHDAEALLQVVRDLSLGVNYQRELVIVCEDLSVLMGKGITEVLTMDEVRSVLESERLSTPLKTKHLFRVLRENLTARYTSRSPDEHGMIRGS